MSQLVPLYRKKGIIVNIGSIAHLYPLPLMNVYCATKVIMDTLAYSLSFLLQIFVLYFSTALQTEYRSKGIIVQVSYYTSCVYCNWSCCCSVILLELWLLDLLESKSQIGQHLILLVMLVQLLLPLEYRNTLMVALLMYFK